MSVAAHKWTRLDQLGETPSAVTSCISCPAESLELIATAAEHSNAAIRKMVSEHNRQQTTELFVRGS